MRRTLGPVLTTLTCLATGLVLSPATSAAPSPTARADGLGRPGTTMISVDADGRPGQGRSTVGDVSRDGRVVVFTSNASNLIPGPAGRRTDQVFAWDRRTGRTELISGSRDGAPADGHSREPVVSANGRHVAFESTALELGRLDNRNGGGADVFVHDRRTGRTRLVSHVPEDRNRTASRKQDTGTDPWISADGSTVVFTSGSREHLREGRGRLDKLLAYDVRSGVVSLVRRPTRKAAWVGWIASPDGRFAAFRPSEESTAIRVWDRERDRVVHRYDLGFDRGNGRAELSANGRYFSGELERELGDSYFLVNGTLDLSGRQDPDVGLLNTSRAADGDALVRARSYVDDDDAWHVEVGRYGGALVSALLTPVPGSRGYAAPLVLSTDGGLLAYDMESPQAIAGPVSSEQQVYVWPTGLK